MPNNSSLKTLVSTDLTPVRLDNSELAVQDDSGHYNPLDVEEYSYTNRELVNLENAAVNIENSNDVIIGPVTQFNVNGNVTIFQNGQEAIEGATIEKEDTPNNNDIPRTEYEYWTRRLLIYIYNHHTFIKNSFIIISLLILSMIAMLIAINKLIYKTEINNGNFDEISYGDKLGLHKVYYRKSWRGLPAKKQDTQQHPAEIVVIADSGTKQCKNFTYCTEIVRAIQKYHMSNSNCPDIGFNFLIGSNSDIFVGRGWDISSFYGPDTIGINVIGNFIYDNFSLEMIDAMKLLIEQGVSLKKISDAYKLVGENQTNFRSNLSPGQNIYKEISKWPHFYNDILFG